MLTNVEITGKASKLVENLQNAKNVSKLVRIQ